MPATTGVAFLIKIFDSGSSTFKTVAGQRSGKLTRTIKDVDSTSKDSAGWEENIPTFRGWQIDFTNLLLETDTAFGDLETAYQNNAQIQVQMLTAAGHTYTGLATLSSLSMEAPHDNVAAISGTLKGTAALTKV